MILSNIAVRNKKINWLTFEQKQQSLVRYYIERSKNH